MGVYCYTYRKETRRIDGKTIGRYDYAYKESFWRSPTQERTLALKHAAADRAISANPNVSLAIVGDFKEAGERKLSVYDFGSDKRSAFFDTPRIPGKFVGYVTKVGRSFRFVECDRLPN